MAIRGQMSATSADVTKGRRHALLYLCSTVTSAKGRSSSELLRPFYWCLVQNWYSKSLFY